MLGVTSTIFCPATTPQTTFLIGSHSVLETILHLYSCTYHLSLQHGKDVHCYCFAASLTHERLMRLRQSLSKSARVAISPYAAIDPTLTSLTGSIVRACVSEWQRWRQRGWASTDASSLFRTSKCFSSEAAFHAIAHQFVERVDLNRAFTLASGFGHVPDAQTGRADSRQTVWQRNVVQLFLHSFRHGHHC
jgi:hypothetical protein